MSIGRGYRPARPAAGRARLFLRCRGRAAGGRHAARNQPYADTLKAIASGGADAFYSGRIAGRHRRRGQRPSDQSGRPQPRRSRRLPGEGAAGGLRALSRLEVCGMGPPSSGALAIGQILGMVEPFDIATLGPDDPESLAHHRRRHAPRLRRPRALHRRQRFRKDSQRLARPGLPQGAQRADPPADRARQGRRQGRRAAMGQGRAAHATQPALELPSTSHIVIVDADGNIASMTTSVENSFGSRLMVDGFILNNQLTDFAFDPGPPDAAVANRVEPGKRPRSSMAPTIVLKDGKPVYRAGLAGRQRASSLRGDDADRADRLEDGHAGGGVAAAFRQPLRPLRPRSRARLPPILPTISPRSATRSRSRS